MRRAVSAIHLHHDGVSRPLENPRLRVLSFGGGVETLAIVEMTIRGEIDYTPDVAIMVDMVTEPQPVYDQIAAIEKRMPYPLIRVSKGDLEADVYRSFETGSRVSSFPAFGRMRDGEVVLMPRQCTYDYKISVVEAEVRRLLGLKPRQRGPRAPVVEMCIGVNAKEIGRIKPARRPYIQNRYVLVEARMSRHDCFRYFAERQIGTPMKSACRMCAFRKNEEWLDLKERSPEDFEAACRVDDLIRAGNPLRPKLKVTRMGLHPSMRPLREVDLAAADDNIPTVSLFNECEGMCGV